MILTEVNREIKSPIEGSYLPQFLLLINSHVHDERMGDI